MSDFDLLIDLHRDGARQGPGGDDETRLAVTLSGLKGKSDLKIADIGCGTGVSTRVLARELDAHITAVDFLPQFLEVARAAADAEGLGGKIETRAAAMEDLGFADQSLDAIWSEGAIYNMGFEAGVRAWARFLKPGGILAVSELTWLTAERPGALQTHWMQEYSEVATASQKFGVLEANGYAPVGYFVLPQYCWLDNYYRPLQSRFAGFLERHKNSDAANAIVRAEDAEIALYEHYAEFYSYGYYIAQLRA